MWYVFLLILIRLKVILTQTKQKKVSNVLMHLCQYIEQSYFNQHRMIDEHLFSGLKTLRFTVCQRAQAIIAFLWIFISLKISLT